MDFIVLYAIFVSIVFMLWMVFVVQMYRKLNK